jgi:hypothetical protein
MIEQKNFDILAFALAMEFRRQIANDVELTDRKQIDFLNLVLAGSRSDICCTHDYCDPNMAMDIALRKLLGLDETYDANDHIDLVNKAWKIAKTLGFSTISEEPSTISHEVESLETVARRWLYKAWGNIRYSKRCKLWLMEDATDTDPNPNLGPTILTACETTIELLNDLSTQDYVKDHIKAQYREIVFTLSSLLARYRILICVYGVDKT